MTAVRPPQWAALAEGLEGHARAAAALAAFTGGEGHLTLIGDERGRLERVLFGLGERGGAGLFRDLAGRLPPGNYALDSAPADLDADEIAIAFALGAYRFDRYKKATPSAHLTTPVDADGDEIRNVSHALALARDMINTPANDLGPLQVETIARRSPRPTTRKSPSR